MKSMAFSQSGNICLLLRLGLAGIDALSRKLKNQQQQSVKLEDLGAFIKKLALLPPSHPLTTLTFALSDLFDIEGHVSTFGHPDWEKTHDPASSTSPAVSTLLKAGATCHGTTVVDEFAYGISGENKHYGTPTNPAVPSRVPGGSSSGAAVAVAANLVHFSLGIDSIGGVRLPAGFCGILGFRPSYGAVSHVGILPISTSLDTVGWFAKDPDILRQVGHILLQAPFVVQCSPRQIIVADDCFQHLNVPLERSSQVVMKATEKLFGIPSLKACSGQKINGELKASSLKLLANIMQFLQRHEFGHMHDEWMNIIKPDLHPAISAQLHEKDEVSKVEINNSISVRSEMRAAVNSLLKDDGILVIPTVADPPPKLGGKEVLSRTLSLLSIASISGCCQVTIPLGFYDNCPVSVSLIARHGGDCFLLDTLKSMYTILQEQANIAATSKSSRNVVSKEQSAEIAKEKFFTGEGEGEGNCSKSPMEDLLGLLRIRIKRGVNFAVRDVNTSEPYVVVKMGKQKLKTRVIKKGVYPECNEDITLSVTDPVEPFVLTVYFSKHDKMGDAELDLRPYIEALKTNLEGLQSGTIITRILSSRQNCLAEESCITYANGKVVQDVVLRLRHVECGEVEIQLQWIDLPGAKCVGQGVRE